MSDQPGKPEDEHSAPDQPPTPEPELVPADEVQLSDPSVPEETLEPTLDTAADEIHLSEPSLSAAEISPESAEAASLEEAAAEAESVAKEAEDVGTLVAGPRAPEDPADAVTPAGTAPAGGTAGDTRDGSDSPGQAGTGGQPESGHDELPAAGDQPPEADQPAEEDQPGEEDQPAVLTSFAASGDDPAWTGPALEQSRWDALFETGQADASTPAGSADRAEAPLVSSTVLPRDDAKDSDAKDSDAKSRDAEDPAANMPTGVPAPPAGAPKAPWAQPFQSPHPQAPGSPVPPVGGPYGLPPAGPGDAAPTRIRARSAGRASAGSGRKKLVILGIVGLVILGLLIFAIFSIVNALRTDDSAAGSANSTPGADGIIAENLSPLDLEAGTCILDFDAANVSADVTTVTCATPHNAQLLATTSFPEDAEFPGDAALNTAGDDLCNSVPIDESAAAEYTGLTLTQVTPTPETWADGDRRIDCFVVSDEGNTITDSLLAG